MKTLKENRLSLAAVRPELWLLPTAGVLAAALGTLILSQYPVHVTDDAFITFRCALNLVAGNGLVFNVGERVEGMTSLLWALLMAVPISLGFTCDSAAILMGSMAAIGAVVVTVLLAWKLTRLRPIALGSGVLLAAQPVFWQVAANGMEMGLYAILFAATTTAIISSRALWPSAFLGTLLFMTRPEGAFLWILGGAYLMARRTWSGSTRPSYRRIGCVLALWMLGIIAVTGWRLAYYGDWIPNSVRAKSLPMDAMAIQDALRVGLRYLHRYVQSLPVLAACAAAGFLFRCKRLEAWFFLGIQLTAAVIVLRNAGDWMPGFRLMTAYLPMAVILIAFLAAQGAALVRGLPRARRCACTLAAALLVVLGWLASAPLRAHAWQHKGLQSFWRTPVPWNDAYSEFARLMLPNLVPTDRVSVSNIGRFGYLVWPQHVHDRLGLADRHIARHGDFIPRYGRMDAAYTLNVVRPEVMLVSQKDRIVKLQPAVYRGDYRRDWLTFEYVYSKERSLYGVAKREMAERLLRGMPIRELEPETPNAPPSP